MGVVGELCRKITPLQPAQTDVLERMAAILELAADVAHAQVTLYARVRAENFLVIVAQARPNTSFMHYKPNLLGTTVTAAEEPLIWRTLQCAQPITGEREWALGMDSLEMRTFPLTDDQGQVIAVASFEASGEEAGAAGHGILVNAAQLLLTGDPPAPGRQEVYRPLSARDGIMIADESAQIVFANAAAASIYKLLGVGRLIHRRLHDRQLSLKPALKAIAAGLAQESELEVGEVVLKQRAIPVVHGERTLLTIVVLADITEIKKKEKELLVKSAVIQEIHHRVKNNLQTIASLLRLQARRTESAAVKAALRESVNRISSIAVVHEFLSQQDEEIIDIAEVAKNILDLIIRNMLEPDFNIQTVFNGERVILPSEQATNLALVINELIQNAIEHGFVGRHEGLLGVDIRSRDAGIQIDIYDDGIGLPPDFNIQQSGSLGLQIVRTLVETDLGGTFRLYSEGGARACIIIPQGSQGG